MSARGVSSPFVSGLLVGLVILLVVLLVLERRREPAFEEWDVQRDQQGRIERIQLVRGPSGALHATG